MNIITKKGEVSKKYAGLIWGSAVQTTIDELNGDIGTKERQKRINKFHSMLNDIVTKSRKFQ